MTARSPIRKSFQPSSSKTIKSPLSSKNDTSKSVSTKAQWRVEKAHSTYLSLNSQQLSNLPPSATQSYVLTLDLENNQFKTDSLQKLPRSLTTLNLINNPLLNMGLPLLKNLRSLYLDNCKLESFQNFPAFPQLRFLSVSNNNIKDFQYLPPLLKLEYFNISNNAFDFSAKLAIAAIGSISINTFNDVRLTPNELIEAFQLSPLVGYSLRLGRDPTPCETPEEEIRKTQDFLTKDFSNYLQSQNQDPKPMNLSSCICKGEPSLICPIESDSIKWYRSHSPEQGQEWVLIPNHDKKNNNNSTLIPSSMSLKKKKPNNVLPITHLLRMHLIMCEFTVGKQTFRVFTDYPLGYDEKDLNLPFPLDPVIAGLPLEGSLISLIPLPLPTRVYWLRENEEIAQDVTSIILSFNEINSVIRCLLQPYCPQYPDVIFSTVFAETDKVDPILPTVSGLQFPDNLVEGVKITFERTFFPDREGESQILVERARGITDEWLVLCQLSPDDLSYIPTCADAGNYLRISYAPVTKEGIIGETIYFYSSTRVLPTLPVFTNGVIGGLPKTHYQICAVADYKGGRKGRCSYNWFMSPDPITTENIRTLQPVASDEEFFEIPEDYADCYMAVEMIPVRDDEVVGDPIYCSLAEPIIEDDPPQPLSVNDELHINIYNGMEINIKEQATFYISSTSGFCGFKEIKRGQSIFIRDQWIGKILRVVTQKSDVILGEIKRQPPIVTTVRIEATNKKYEINYSAQVQFSPNTLTPDQYQIIWIRVCGNIEKVVAFNTPTYTFSTKDIGYSLKVRITPLDENGNLLEWKESELTPTIQDEDNKTGPQIVGTLLEGKTVYVDYKNDDVNIKWFRSDPKETWIDTGITDKYYTISKEDTGRYLRAQLQQNEAIPIPLIVTTTDTCSAAPPVIESLKIPSVVSENDVITPKYAYFGGTEGKTIIKWFRGNDNAWTPISDKLTYKVTAEDTNSKLRFKIEPVRSDGVHGKPVFHIINVQSNIPTVTDVSIKQNERGFIELTGKYAGGIEGESYFIWFAIDQNGKQHNIGKSNLREIYPPAQIFGLEVTGIYVPRRADGEEGDQVRSSNSVIVKPLPTIDSIDILVKDGLVQVGQPMRCKVVCSDNSKIKYQWYRGHNQVEEIPNETRADYVPTVQDVGQYIQCLAIPFNKEGWEGKGIGAITPTPVEDVGVTFKVLIAPEEYQPKPPASKFSTPTKIPTPTRSPKKQATPTKKEEERKFVTGTVLITNYNDGEEVTWERLKSGPNVDPANNENWEILCDSPTYQLTINDIGCRLRAAIDDLETKPTPVIKINPKLGSFVNAQVRAKSLQFKAKSATGTSHWDFFCDQSGITMKSKRQNLPMIEKKSPWRSIRIDGVDGYPDQMILWMDAATKFILVPTMKEDLNKKQTNIENPRDFIVSTLKQFIEKFSA